MDILQRIRDLQFSDKGSAEALLLGFLRENTPYAVASVELTPRPTSLNSFNGFLRLETGQRLFFKTHTESHTIIQEYYNAELLASAGYPIIAPVYRSTEVGKQLLIYEVIDDPCLFDVAWDVETGKRGYWGDVELAQAAADKQLWDIYQATMQIGSDADSPVHQLFYHRLVGGRLANFYAPEKSIRLPQGNVSLDAVRRAKWHINGQFYRYSLEERIQQAIDDLKPGQTRASVIGHGDAHNGNVFLRGLTTDVPHMLYFDPAFAGRHHPLLDLAKPLFHNVFAMWMYFPQEKDAQLNIHCEMREDTWYVEHDYTLHPIRQLFLRHKADELLLPLLEQLGLGTWGWQYLSSALLCCALLTMNLADATRFPPSISLLGLAMSVELAQPFALERYL